MSAVSVSLPTWESNVGWATGERWVVDNMLTGYPRFFIHRSIESFAETVASNFSHTPGQRAMLFPNEYAAQLCVGFLHAHASAPALVGIETVALFVDDSNPDAVYWKPLCPSISAVIFHPDAFKKSNSFEFPYVGTLKILEKFGSEYVFYGNATEIELDDIQHRLERGERYLALFCEFPGNPLLTCPKLKRIRSLADKYDFAIVVDETIGTFANVNVFQHADVVVTSLTKFLSGACNVTRGSAVFNPTGGYYSSLKAIAEREYKDTYWPEDVILMERNSRDFTTRIRQMNINAETAAKVLLASPLIKRVYYPKYNSDKSNYEARRTPVGRYGGLMSVVFHRKQDAITFHDDMDGAKGPRLEWVSSLGVDPYLIRFSVGMEDTDRLLEIFRKALHSAAGPREGCNIANATSHSE
ncbi:Cystathionine gamma-synthase [Colletotrichum viniferum]|nr:Cystathionine gamma-synthase [Colletotrichum viniferum]